MINCGDFLNYTYSYIFTIITQKLKKKNNKIPVARLPSKQAWQCCKWKYVIYIMSFDNFLFLNFNFDSKITNELAWTWIYVILKQKNAWIFRFTFLPQLIFTMCAFIYYYYIYFMTIIIVKSRHIYIQCSYAVEDS